jgi:ParB family chromosome partitioning protein
MSVENIREVGIENLDPNPFQPRVEHHEEELKDLGRSIKENGLVEPIIVRPHRAKPGCYQICVGERRVRACQLVGIATVLAIVRDLSDKEMALYVLVENLQRRNLNPIEQARGFKMLLEQSNWTQEEMAKEVGGGLTRDIIAQSLRLLSFPPGLQELVSHDTITPTHAEALATLADEPSLLKKTIPKVLDHKLTTKETEQLVKDTLRRGELGKDILDYLTGEQFAPMIYYICYWLSSGGHEYCPFCLDDKVVYDENNQRQRMVCQKCGWELGLDHGPLFEIVRHIGELRRVQGGTAKN